MYEFLKNIIKEIVPKKYLFENENRIRRMLYPFYKGNSFECTICNSRLKHFTKVQNGNLVCPVCGSIGRTRRLYILLEKEFLKKNMDVLDFSPSRALYRKLKNNTNIRYFPTDYGGDFLGDFQYDITQIDCPDNTFDLIICYHILEHIIEDTKAMSELFRVLKPGGKVLIQTPFKEGEIYEDYSVTTEKDRLRCFGQEDHVRIYSVNGLTERLTNVGFRTEVRIYPQDEYLGMPKDEKVIICTKQV